MTRPRIALLTTGGTIASQGATGKATPKIAAAAFLEQIPEIEDTLDVLPIDVAQTPGSHLTLETIAGLSRKIVELADAGDIDGAVVTQGTDTLEETAFALDVTVGDRIPVALTGAMRTASEAGYEGYRNLADALRAAGSADVQGLGTLVVFNQQIHAARWVTKRFTQTPETFGSPDFGPLGHVYPDGVYISMRPARSIPRLKPIFSTNVEVLTLGIDPSPRLLQSLLQNHQGKNASTGGAGIVIGGFGAGRVTPEYRRLIAQATQMGISVAIASRTHGGRLWDPYGYTGAHRDLADLGCLFGQGLGIAKTRLLLMLALGNALTANEQAVLFGSL